MKLLHGLLPVLALWWFLVHHDGLTVRWGPFPDHAECRALLEKVAGTAQTSGCLTDQAISKEYQGPLAGETT